MHGYIKINSTPFFKHNLKNRYIYDSNYNQKLHRTKFLKRENLYGNKLYWKS